MLGLSLGRARDTGCGDLQVRLDLRIEDRGRGGFQMAQCWMGVMGTEGINDWDGVVLSAGNIC